MSNKCVIFPTDFSDVSVEALPWAKQMANSMDASVKCLYIVEEPQIYTSLDMGATAIPTTGELLDSAKSRMTKFVADNLGTKDSGEVLVGHAATEIVKCAEESGAGMIVMSTHGYSGMTHVLLGSTTSDVIRHAGCPVLSVRSGS